MAPRTQTQGTSRGRRSTGGRAPRSSSRAGSRSGTRRTGATHSGARSTQRSRGTGSGRASRKASSGGEMEFSEVGAGEQEARLSSRYDGFTGEVAKGQVEELLLQALETEVGGIQVYETALRCARDEELREEWTKYLEQTRNHERILTDVFRQCGLDTRQESTGRTVVRRLGESLVEAMEMALERASPAAAELVAAECVVLAETKDHLNWELIGEVAEAMGEEGHDLKEAHDEVEQEEDEHLYHTMGWSRELWLQSLGLPAVIPPPEETRDVTSAIGAARAKQARKRMLKKAA